MSESLRTQATSGVIWSAVELFGKQGCNFFVQLILARLIAPEEFGLIAMIVVFVAIAMSVVDAGFGNALVQKKDIDEADLNTVFFFNILTAILMTGAIWLAAPAIARFYEQDRLVGLLRWLSLSLVLGSFGGVHEAILGRQLEFKKLFWVTLPSIVFGGIAGVVLALFGFGAWALVAQALLVQFTRSLSLWLQTGWKPRLLFDLRSLRMMFPYGSRLAASGMLNQTFQNLYVLVIGKAFSPIDVGYFQRAQSFQQLPASSVQAILSRVAFPLFSKIQDDPVRIRRVMSKAIRLSSLFVFATMAGMAAIAEPMVVTLIGERWRPASVILQWLCLAGALFPIHAINLNLLMAMGESKLFLRLELFKKGAILISIYITYRFGVLPMIWGMIATSIISLGFNTFYTAKFVDYTFNQQFRDIIPSFFLSITMFAGVTALNDAMDASALVELVAGISLGACMIGLGLRFLGADIKNELKTISQSLPGGRLAARFLL
jgi:teichuronic acid exporter